MLLTQNKKIFTWLIIINFYNKNRTILLMTVLKTNNTLESVWHNHLNIIILRNNKVISTDNKWWNSVEVQMLVYTVAQCLIVNAKVVGSSPFGGNKLHLWPCYANNTKKKCGIHFCPSAGKSQNFVGTCETEYFNTRMYS